MSSVHLLIRLDREKVLIVKSFKFNFFLISFFIVYSFEVLPVKIVGKILKKEKFTFLFTVATGLPCLLAEADMPVCS